jgi:hypothetical protein
MDDENISKSQGEEDSDSEKEDEDDENNIDSDENNLDILMDLGEEEND